MTRREPTVVFALVAAALFAVSWLVESGRDRRIQIDPDELAWRIQQVEAARGAPVTPELRREVERAYVDERILVREALERGLDDDPRIHDLLVQKMLHVLSGDVIQPTQPEIESYYREHLDRYAPAPTIAGEEIVVPPDAPDASTLPSELAEGTPPADLLGGILVTHRIMDDLTREEVAELFDGALADSAFAMEPGQWVGPHESARGWHWLRVNDRSEPGPLPLERVREQVRLDWVAEREEAMLEERLEVLRREYGVEPFDGVDP